MALNRSSASRRTAALLAFGLLVLAGCSGGPLRDGASSPARPSQPAAPETSRIVPASNWETFAASGAALRRDIQRRAEAMQSGPVGNRAVELASLRITANAQDLIDGGSLDGALVALQRAVSLYGGNGYAYLFLAYVHHVQGHPQQAGEFAGNAARFLPRQPPVRAELAGLRLSIDGGAQGTATTTAH